MKFCLLLLPLLLTLLQALPVLAQDASAGTGKELVWTFNGHEQLSTGSPRLVLKNSNTMLVLNKAGMIEAGPGSPYGLYENDTRFLSRWQILIDGKEPTLLTALTQKGYEASFLCSILDDVLIERDIALLDGMNEKITIRSFV